MNNAERLELKSRKRFNILIVLIYIVGLILLASLFNLQIIHGPEYREQSNQRLTREARIEAPRGEILDRNGVLLATNEMGFSLQMYKSKIDDQALNNTILNIVNVLSSNGDTYIDAFPITIDPLAFSLENEEAIAKWKKDNKIDEKKTIEEIFDNYKTKYKLENENIENARKIMGIRYEIEKQGYSSRRPITISKNISRQSALVIAEQSANFPGVSVGLQPIRKYEKGTLAAHILGYISKINQEEYDEYKDEGYYQTDYIGKAGIESVLEGFLKGKDGIKQIDMDASREL